MVVCKKFCVIYNNVNSQQIEKSEEIKYKLGQAEWKCLNVDNSNPSDKNKFNDTSILIELNHHIAKGTTSKEFLQKIKPTYAIISAGNNKDYNHPDEKTIQRLIEEGIKQAFSFLKRILYGGTYFLDKYRHHFFIINYFYLEKIKIILFFDLFFKNRCC